MDEKKCECKLISLNSPSVFRGIIAYELAAIIILFLLIQFILDELILIQVDLNELKEKINLVKSTQKETSPEE